MKAAPAVALRRIGFIRQKIDMRVFPNPWALAADALMALHLLVVLFVVGGLLYVWAGYRRHWPGARAWPLRLAHLGSIGFVAVQAWLGRICPLTIWEMALRQRAGQTTHGDSFVAHWLSRLLYWEAPPWAFTTAYTLFGLAVLLTWWWMPPERRQTSEAQR